MSDSVEARMPKQLPLFEGRRPDYAENAFSGRSAALVHENALKAGHTYFAVVEFEVAGVSHDEKETKDETLFIRTQKCKVARSALLDPKEATRFLQDARNGNQTHLSIVREDGSTVDVRTGEITE